MSLVLIKSRCYLFMFYGVRCAISANVISSLIQTKILNCIVISLYWMVIIPAYSQLMAAIVSFSHFGFTGEPFRCRLFRLCGKMGWEWTNFHLHWIVLYNFMACFSYFNCRFNAGSYKYFSISFHVAKWFLTTILLLFNTHLHSWVFSIVSSNCLRWGIFW